MIAEAAWVPPRRRRRARIGTLLMAGLMIAAGAAMLIHFAVRPIHTESSLVQDARELAPDAVIVKTTDDLERALRTEQRVIVADPAPDAEQIVWPCFWTSVLTCGMFVLVYAAGKEEER